MGYNRFADYRADAAIKLAASLAATRHPHQPGALYTHDQVVGAALTIGTMLARQLTMIEEIEQKAEDGTHGCDTCEKSDDDLPKPTAKPTAPPLDAPSPPATPPATAPASDAPQGNVEPPKPNADAPIAKTDEAQAPPPLPATSPQSPAAKRK